MLRNARRLGAIAAAAVTATTVLVPLASSEAWAVTPTEYTVFVSDTDGDGSYGLYQRPAPTGARQTIVAESATSDVSDLATSADGSRVVYMQTTLDATSGQQLAQKLVVRDISKQVVRTVDQIAGSDSTFDMSPALSPDGTTVVWTQIAITSTSFTVKLLRASVGSGSPTVIASGYGGGVFLNGSTLLVQDLAGAALTLPAAGGSATAVAGTGVPAMVDDLTVSPDGTQLAWSLDTTPNGASVSTGDIQVAPVSVTSGTATVGAATTVATGLDNLTPSFSGDSATVYFTKYDGDVGNGDVWSTPAAGPPASAAVAAATLSEDDIDVAVGTTDDGTLPGSATTAAAALAGTSAVIRFGLPSDTDLSGVLLKRSLGATPQKSVYVPAPLTGYLDTGLVVGSTYTYAFTSVDRSGNQAATAATRMLTAVAAQPSFRDPTSITATRPPFLVRFAGNTPANVHYTVDYRLGNSTFTRWVTDTAGAYRTFGSAASAGVAATTSTVGATYTFKVGATDGFGNSTPVVTGARGVVPFDQSRATLYGGRTTGLTSTWLGSVYLLRSPVGYARLSLPGDRFQIIGERCLTCGVMDVYDGTTRVASIDTRASTRVVRSVLYTRTYATVGPHTLTIKSRGTAGRPNVFLDAFGARR